MARVYFSSLRAKLLCSKIILQCRNHDTNSVIEDEVFLNVLIRTVSTIEAKEISVKIIEHHQKKFSKSNSSIQNTSPISSQVFYTFLLQARQKGKNKPYLTEKTFSLFSQFINEPEFNTGFVRGAKNDLKSLLNGKKSRIFAVTCFKAPFSEIPSSVYSTPLSSGYFGVFKNKKAVLVLKYTDTQIIQFIGTFQILGVSGRFLLAVVSANGSKKEKIEIFLSFGSNVGGFMFGHLISESTIRYLYAKDYHENDESKFFKHWVQKPLSLEEQYGGPFKWIGKKTPDDGKRKKLQVVKSIQSLVGLQIEDSY